MREVVRSCGGQFGRSTTTDRVREAPSCLMRSIPFGLRNRFLLIVAILLPFVPVALMFIPFVVILEQVAKLFS